MADVHLGGWKFPELQDLNFKSFQKAINISILERVDFVLIAGDIFDNPYPSIEILKETFAEFKKLHDEKIPCFIIAGSHDYSVSGKTFLDVLEKTGFCKNVEDFDEVNDEIILKPTIHNEFAIYGYPGKKTGLEVKELKKIKLLDSSLFKILMLHTTLDRVVGDLPIDFVDSSKLPKAEYYALGHIHVLYNKDRFVYPGPVFPNNFAELEALGHGAFNIVEADTINNELHVERIDLKLKEVISLGIEVKDASIATEKIISEIDKEDIVDKIILLRINGELEKGKNSDINFYEIEKYAKDKGAYFILKNTHNLKTVEPDLDFEIDKTENIEDETIKVYSEQNPSDFNKIIPLLVNSLSIEKQEGETSESFSNRILEESKKILGF